jgi:hypothetical protein
LIPSSHQKQSSSGVSQQDKEEILQTARTELKEQFKEEIQKVRAEAATSIAKCTKEKGELQKALNEKTEEMQQYKAQTASALEGAKQESSHVSTEKALLEYAAQADKEKEEALSECKVATEKALQEYAAQADKEKEEALSECKAHAALAMQQALTHRQEGDDKDEETRSKALEQCKASAEAEGAIALQQCKAEAAVALESKLAELRVQLEAERGAAVRTEAARAKEELHSVMQVHGAQAALDKSSAVKLCKVEQEEKLTLALGECRAAGKASEKKLLDDSEAKVDQAVTETAAKFGQKMMELSTKLEEVETVFAGKTAQALKEAEAAAALDKEAALDSVKTECDKAVADAAAERDEYMSLYSQEAKKRRVVHNKLMDMMGNIRVVCRIRPVLTVDCKTGARMNVLLPLKYHAL